MLSIDTEGNDMRVLLGAVRLLGAEMIRFLEFEYHKVGHWATADLSGKHSTGPEWARRGEARRGEARRGEARRGEARLRLSKPRQSLARLSEPRRR